MQNKSLPVLIVEDSTTVRNLISQMLTALGFEQINEATDGTTALAKLREQPHGLVLTDWHMPGLNGRQLIEQVRKDPALASIPIIVIAGDEGDGEEGVRIGANAYLGKPFRRAQLAEKIDALP